MALLVINGDEVRALLPMAECMTVMEQTLAATSAGDALLPLRTIMWLPERIGALGMMPAFLPGRGVLGLKAITVFPGNHGTPLDAHQGAVLVFEASRGRPLAVVDATTITAVRTAAVSGVATRWLARPDAGDLAVLGSGTQARTHLAAMREARPLRRVRVWSRTSAHAARLAEEEADGLGVRIEVAADARAAVEGADLICTVTASAEPVLQGAWLAAGAHVNAVGSSTRFARELDAAAVARARLYVDRRESAFEESGDFLAARAEGAVDDGHIVGEIGEVVLGRIPGRRSPEEITLFESLGLAVEDLAAAHHVYLKARTQGAGTWVPLARG